MEKTYEYHQKVKELRAVINKVKFRLMQKYGIQVAKYWSRRLNRTLDSYREEI